MNAVQLLQDQMKLAESQTEAWQQYAEDARNCEALEFMLRTWLHILDEIENLDNKVRLLVLRGEAKLESEEPVTRYFQQWVREAEKNLLPFLPYMEEKGYQVEGAEAFRSRYRELQASLIPDDEFFDGEKLIALRDEAIDDHRRGKTEEWGVPVS